MMYFITDCDESSLFQASSMTFSIISTASKGGKYGESLRFSFSTFERYPFDEDLHIVAHSLGSVILWDILFSDTFSPNDPAFYIRNVIKGLSGPGEGRKVKLRSITTLGSPLLFFNRALNIDIQRLKQFASRYTGKPLRWINIIHASDIFAYPIRTSFELEGSSLFVRDVYLGERNF